MANFPEGIYDVEADSVCFGESAERKTPYCAIVFTPLADNPQQYQREVRLWLTEAATPRSEAILLEHFPKWTGDTFLSLTNEVVRGVRFQLSCKHNDRGFEDWDFPAPQREREGGRLTPELLARVDKFLTRKHERKQVPDSDVPF